MLYSPLMCGTTKKCPYDNDCLAELAGYDVANQCEPYTPPATCTTVPSGSCSGEPKNPVKCGPNYECKYDRYALR
jgi:hypothetical protein